MSQSQGSPDEARGQLTARIFRSMKEEQIDEKVFTAVEAAFIEALKNEKIVLSLSEKDRLWSDVLKLVLGDVLGRNRS